MCGRRDHGLPRKPFFAGLICMSWSSFTDLQIFVGAVLGLLWLSLLSVLSRHARLNPDAPPAAVLRRC